MRQNFGERQEDLEKDSNCLLIPKVRCRGMEVEEISRPDARKKQWRPCPLRDFIITYGTMNLSVNSSSKPSRSQ